MTNREAPGATLLDNPELISLARLRRRVVLLLSCTLMALYVVNMLLLSVFAEVATRPLGEASKINVGIAWSTGLVVASILVSGIYTWWASRYFDPRMRELVANARPHSTL